MYTTSMARNTTATPWLVLLFSLPRAQASGRVDVWRRLRRTGALPLESGGHVLPNSQENRERFEWLAESVRHYKGTAQVLTVASFGELAPEELKQRFIAARSADYVAIVSEAKKIKAGDIAELSRLRKRLQDVVAMDHFGGAMRERAERALGSRSDDAMVTVPKQKLAIPRQEFCNRVWQTRPRPGIDRCASAWLIVNHIDPKARFKFGSEPLPKTVTFDMYQPGGFGHRGDECTFETLMREFKLGSKSLRVLAEMVHDADIKDEKYGRTEAIAVDKILKGWAASGMADQELLSKGMELIDGLCRSIG
jgi:hypothetical protein